MSSLLLDAIKIRIIRDASTELQDSDLSTWEKIKTVLKNKYGDQDSFEQQIYTLMATSQKQNESVSDFHSRVKELQYQLLQSLKEKGSINTLSDLICFLVKQTFIEKCLPALSKFLHCLDSNEEETLQSLVNKAKHEEEKIKKGSYSSSLSKNQKPATNAPTKKKWCSYHKVDRHFTADCRSPNISICSNCKLKGHESKDCRLKSADKANGKTVRKMATTPSPIVGCRNCKESDHVIENCPKLLKKKQEKFQSSEIRERNVRIVKVRSVQINPEIPKPEEKQNAFVCFSAPEWKRNLIFQIDNGAEISVIYKNQLPLNTKIDTSEIVNITGPERSEDLTKTLGFVWVPLNFKQKTIDVRMHVINNYDFIIEKDGLLGNPFCHAIGAVIDYVNNCVSFPLHNTSFPFHKEFVVPGKTRKTLMIRVANSLITTGIFNPEQLPPSLTAVDSIVSVSKNGTISVGTSNQSLL